MMDRASTSDLRGWFFCDPLCRHAKIYISSIVAIGMPILCFSLYHSLTRPDLTWLLYAGGAILLSCFPFQLPPLVRDRMWVAPNDVIVILAILFFGPEVAVSVAAIEALTFSLRKRKIVRTPYRFFFNLAQIVIVAFVAGQIFKLFGLAGIESLATRFLIVVGCGLYYFFLNSGLVASAVALSNRQPLRPVLSASLSRIHLHFAGALLTGIIFLYLNSG